MLQSLSISVSCPLLHCLRADDKLWMLIKKERNSVSGINSERVTQKMCWCVEEFKSRASGWARHTWNSVLSRSPDFTCCGELMCCRSWKVGRSFTRRQMAKTRNVFQAFPPWAASSKWCWMCASTFNFLTFCMACCALFYGQWRGLRFPAPPSVKIDSQESFKGKSLSSLYFLLTSA